MTRWYEEAFGTMVIEMLNGALCSFRSQRHVLQHNACLDINGPSATETLEVVSKPYHNDNPSFSIKLSAKPCYALINVRGTNTAGARICSIAAVSLLPSLHNTVIR
jgi:hypothetical protein